MTISDAGIANIKRYEGCSLTVYDDQAGLPTIGWGHLIRAGEPFDSTTKLTQAEADALFVKDLRPFVLGVEACLEVEVTQAAFDAMVSFSYNVGLGALRSSSFLRAVNSKSSNADIRACLMRWDKITVRGQKVRSEGLAKRRADESKAWP